MRLLWTVTGIGDICWYCRYLQPLEMHIAIGDTYLLLIYCQSTEHSASQLIFQMYMCESYFFKCSMLCCRNVCYNDSIVSSGNVVMTVLCTPGMLPGQCCVHQQCCHASVVYTRNVAIGMLCTPGMLPLEWCVHQQCCHASDVYTRTVARTMLCRNAVIIPGMLQ